MDQFAGWTKLLALAQAHKTKSALRAAIGESGLQIIETEPLSGYYRSAAVKDGPLLPVAIWQQDGVLYVMRGGEPVQLSWVWPNCVWRPISYEWYEGAIERGEKWPDAAAETAPAETGAHTQSISEPREAIGGNNPPVEDEAAAIKSKIESAKVVAETAYAAINNDEEADAAQSLRSRLLSLTGDADKKREAEKKPHYEKAKAADTKWMPVVKLGKDTADWLRGKLSDYATRKARKEAEDARAAEAARLAEEARIGAEKPADENWPEPGPERAEEPTPPPPAAVTATTFKGATGRAATIRPIKIAKVVDYDKAYAHLKAIPEIKAAIDKVAQRMVTAGQDVPGVDVEDQRAVA